VRHELTSIAWSLVAIVERMDALLEALNGPEHANGSHDQAHGGRAANDAKASELPTRRN
jgi:hypothetical protein